MTSDEQNGLILFQSHCQGCHSTALFTDQFYHNNSIDDEFLNDGLEGIFQGRYRVTSDSSNMGKFKTPTLRNIAVTAPYMHDGRFGSLAAVVDHYRHGIKKSKTLDKLCLPKVFIFPAWKKGS